MRAGTIALFTAGLVVFAGAILAGRRLDEPRRKRLNNDAGLKLVLAIHHHDRQRAEEAIRNLSEPGVWGDSAILDAALVGETELVRQLLERGVPVGARSTDGRTPLLCAVQGGHVDTAKLLLDRGANVNAMIPSGRTPLMEAASRGDAPMVQLLLSHRADPQLQDQKGKTALQLAASAKGGSAAAAALRAAGSRE
jgi:ankyrin repeat protein